MILFRQVFCISMLLKPKNELERAFQRDFSAILTRFQLNRFVMAKRLPTLFSEQDERAMGNRLPRTILANDYH